MPTGEIARSESLWLVCDCIPPVNESLSLELERHSAEQANLRSRTQSSCSRPVAPNLSLWLFVPDHKIVMLLSPQRRRASQRP
jgi:hypothetical protein